MNDRDNKPAKDNSQAQPSSELDKLIREIRHFLSPVHPIEENSRDSTETELNKLLREFREFLNPMPPTEGMGLAEMKQNIEGIKEGLGLKPRK